MVTRRLVLTLTSFLAATLTLFCNVTAHAFNRSVFDNLDYGIYFYQDQLLSQKAGTGPANAYFTNGKPTLIYIHGLQRDKTPLLYRETFARAVDQGPTQDLTVAWKSAGWNMSIHYWNQFSDEGDVNDAEAKYGALLAQKRCAGVKQTVAMSIAASVNLAPNFL